MAATQSKVEGLINDNAVVVFSKSWCSYSRAAKKLLTEMGAKFETIELDQVDDGQGMQDALLTLTGQSTVPNIFINKEHIGGNSQLQAKKGPALKELLVDAKAL